MWVFPEVRDELSSPYKITGKIVGFYRPIIIFTFLYSSRGDKIFWAAWQQALPEFKFS
jgi:hypothetical protein